MKWITRERPKIDRVACPWLIARFIDTQPEFLFVPADKVHSQAAVTGAIPYDVAGGSTQAIELGAPDGTAVYAPLNGQVVALTANVINGDARRWGTILGIQPDDDPAHVLTISALTLDPAGAPSRPEIGRQVRVGQLLGRVRDTSSVVTSVLSRYVADRGSGITLRLEPSVSG